MRLYKYLNEEVTKDEMQEFISRWKTKFKSYGVTEFDFSIHKKDRINHKRNKPPIRIEELDFILNAFLKKEGSQFKKDVENVKNHTAKKRGLNKKEIPDNELEFAITSNSSKIKFVFVLKQDRHTKGTAIVLPMTIIRNKNFKITKGIHVMVERRNIWI